MQTYECPRCAYTTCKKNDLVRHLNRKQLCNAIDSEHNIPIEDIHIQYGINNIHELNIQEPIQDIVTEIANLKFIVQELLDFKKKLMDEFDLDNTSACDAYDAFNFGNEDTSHLTYEFQKKCLLQGQEGLVNRFKAINFNDDKPCNHNVKIGSKKRKEFKVFQNNKWITKDMNKMYLEILCKQKSELYKFYKDNVEKDIELLNMTDIFDVFKNMLKTTGKEFYAIRRDLFSFISSYQI